MSARNRANALKLFLPSWNFFSDFAGVPVVDYRLTGGGLESTGWRPLHQTRSTKNLRRVFLNPWGNLELLERAHFDRAEEELAGIKPEGMEDFMKGGTYATLSDVVRMRINDLHPSLRQEKPAGFQFRISRTASSGNLVWSFLSAEHSMDGSRAHEGE